MSVILLIDGNSIAHANHHATKLTIGNGSQVQAVFGFIKSMRALKEKYPVSDFIVLWDGKAKWRFELYPEYKSNRGPKTPEEEQDKAAYKAQVPLIQKALGFMGIRQLLNYDLEADDLAGFLSRQLSKTRKVILVSGDQDWIQLVSPTVTWFDPIRDRVVTHANFFESTGYQTPHAFLQGKALMGDTSDAISGVGGIGEGTAPVFLAEFGSVENFWRLCDEAEKPPKSKVHRRLWEGRCEHNKEAWEALYTGDKSDAKALKKHMDAWPGQGRILFERNMKLMDLINAPAPNPEQTKKFPAVWNREKFKMVCERLNFQSILREMHNYESLFA